MKSPINTKILLGFTLMTFSVPAVVAEKIAGEEELKNQAEGRRNVPKMAIKPGCSFAYLGLGVEAQVGLGLSVYMVKANSAAEKAGLKQNDILTKFDGKAIGSVKDFYKAVRDKKTGDEVLVKFLRHNNEKEKKITLGEDNSEYYRVDGDTFSMGLNGGRVVYGHKNEMRSGESMTWTGVDGKGSCTNTVKDLGGKKVEIIRVKDEHGRLLFEGSYLTEKDKSAVPEGIQVIIERIKKNGTMSCSFTFLAMKTFCGRAYEAQPPKENQKDHNE